MKEVTVSKTKDANLGAILEESRQLREEIDASIQADGNIYQLSEWVTIKEYARRHQLETTNVVSNWITRGKITAEDIRDFPYLNDLRLIRDKEYR